MLVRLQLKTRCTATATWTCHEISVKAVSRHHEQFTFSNITMSSSCLSRFFSLGPRGCARHHKPSSVVALRLPAIVCFSHPRESHAEGRSISSSLCPASDFARAFLRLQTLQLSRYSVRRCVAARLTTEEGSWQRILEYRS